MSGGASATLLLTLSLILVLRAPPSTASFKCQTKLTCHSLVDYIPQNQTNLSEIRDLFEVKNFRSILGANSLPLSTPPTYAVPAKQKIRIPFNCACANGTGHSDGRPVYTVQKGDDLSHIAENVFSRLVTYQEIAAANNISPPYLILVGQKLSIPLPCSCDDVGRTGVVHYGHLVEMGSSVSQIANEYGTDEETLLRLNGISDPKTLQAGSVLDVPLKACGSHVGRDSMDYPLLVSNGTYVFTATNCIMCKCEAANNWTLQCEQTQLKSSLWPSCPVARCQGADNLFVGNTTSPTPTGCNRSACAYAGYTNQTILRNLVNISTCSSTAPDNGNDNYAPRICFQASIWNFLLILGLLHLLLL